MAKKDEEIGMDSNEENTLPPRRYSEHYLEAMEAYSMYCLELALEGKEGSTLSLEPPDWEDYLVEYLLEELESLQPE